MGARVGIDPVQNRVEIEEEGEHAPLAAISHGTLVLALFDGPPSPRLPLAPTLKGRNTNRLPARKAPSRLAPEVRVVSVLPSRLSKLSKWSNSTRLLTEGIPALVSTQDGLRPDATEFYPTSGGA